MLSPAVDGLSGWLSSGVCSSTGGGRKITLERADGSLVRLLVSGADLLPGCGRKTTLFDGASTAIIRGFFAGSVSGTVGVGGSVYHARVCVAALGAKVVMAHPADRMLERRLRDGGGGG